MGGYALKGFVAALALAAALQAARADLRIGVAGHITGPNASFGAQLTQGVGQAAEDFNKSGGILGQKVSVEQGDDVSDPKQGVSVANKFVGDGVTDDEFAQTGGPGVEGTLLSFGPEPRNNPNARQVIAEFKAKGYDPQGYTLYSYAAMQIFKEAAEAVKSLDPKKMAEYMHSGKPFHTVLGDVAYDKKGDRTTVDYVWYVWEKGADGKITFHQM